MKNSKNKSTEGTMYIKNMVCPRCIMAVEKVLTEMQILFVDVNLGQVKLTSPMSVEQRALFAKKLEILGFELLEQSKSKLISKIKSLIIERIHYGEKYDAGQNFSSYLADKLHHEYSYISRLFSSTEGITIEKYIALQKIERIKELLFYDELTLSEIANQMQYSSVAYLSTQFKRETGMTPTEFKNTHKPGHKYRDSLS